MTASSFNQQAIPSTPGPTPPSQGVRTLLGGAILVAVLAILVVSSLAFSPEKKDWEPTVAIVAAVCGTSSLGGWLVTRLGASYPALAVSGSLGGMALRLLMPLLLLGWLSVDPPTSPEAQRLREAGARGLLVVFYLTLLATDIVLHIIWGPKGPGRPLRRHPPSP